MNLNGTFTLLLLSTSNKKSIAVLVLVFFVFVFYTVFLSIEEISRDESSRLLYICMFFIAHCLTNVADISDKMVVVVVVV